MVAGKDTTQTVFSGGKTERDGAPQTKFGVIMSFDSDSPSRPSFASNGLLFHRSSQVSSTGVNA